MRRLEYPESKLLEKSYKDVFHAKILQMQQEWDTIRKTHAAELGHISQNVSDILVASYVDLMRWYIAFKSLPLKTRNVINDDLSKLFSYDDWRTEIAEFFKDPKNGIKISSCHYCDMAYINAFEVNPDEDALYFLNTASDDELHRLTKSASRIEYVKKQRPYKCKADYDKVAKNLSWSTNKWDKLFKPNYKYRHHFDLDHVLPKSEFALVGLSLYNFVPSCQICNQKLKKTRVIGPLGIPMEKLSPTSPKFDGRVNIEFRIMFKPGSKAGALDLVGNPQDYDLKLYALDKDYEYFIKLFKLEERYQQHKRIALHWLEMRYKYSDAKINMMVAALNNPSFNFTRIKSDIFQNDLYRDDIMTFTKLREDILK